MPRYTIDSNGTAIAADGTVVGQRGPDGRLQMFQTKEDPAIAEIAAKAAEMKRVAQDPSAAGDIPPAESPSAFPKESTVVPIRMAERRPGQDPPSTPANPAPAPATISYTKYEVRPDSVFTIRFCLGFRDERVQVYTEDARFKLPGLESHWVTFRMWTFREELDWRNRTTVFDQPTRSWRADPGKFNDLKIRNLLRDWSLAEIDPKFRLLHVNGALCDESYNAVMGLFPNILDNIIYLMNRILEDNG